MWWLKPRVSLDPYLQQQAVLSASRGPRSTLFHLLFPICVIANFVVFYLVPRLVAGYWESAWFAHPLLLYAKWSLPVFIVVNLITYNRARNRLLAPHIRELTNNQVTHQPR